RPTSPLFPYTTLFRSLFDLVKIQCPVHAGHALAGQFVIGIELQRAMKSEQSPAMLPDVRVADAAHDMFEHAHARQDSHRVPGKRSEEHTSELQSLTNL